MVVSACPSVGLTAFGQLVRRCSLRVLSMRCRNASGGTGETAGVCRDPHLVLGVHKRASQAEIRNAYIREAKRLHPDANTAIGAEDAFRTLHEAYEVLNSSAGLRGDNGNDSDSWSHATVRSAFHVGDIVIYAGPQKFLADGRRLVFGQRGVVRSAPAWGVLRVEFPDQKYMHDIIAEMLVLSGPDRKSTWSKTPQRFGRQIGFYAIAAWPVWLFLTPFVLQWMAFRKKRLLPDLSLEEDRD